MMPGRMYANISIFHPYVVTFNNGCWLSIDPTTTCPPWRTARSYILTPIEGYILLPFSSFLCSSILSVLINVSQRPINILTHASVFLILTYELKEKKNKKNRLSQQTAKQDELFASSTANSNQCISMETTFNTKLCHKKQNCTHVPSLLHIPITVSHYTVDNVGDYQHWHAHYWHTILFV